MEVLEQARTRQRLCGIAMSFSFFYAHSLEAWKVPGGAWFLASALLAITVVLSFGVGDVRQDAAVPENAVA